MKILAVFLALISSVSYAQKDSYKWRAEMNLGIDVYSARTNFNARTDNGAATRFLKLGGLYYFMEDLGVGLVYDYHLYFLEPYNDSATQVTDARANGLSLISRYNIINKPKFVWYGSVSVGGKAQWFSLENRPTGATGYVEMTGFSFNLESGMIRYFGDHLGVNLSLGFSNANYLFYYIEVQGTELEYFRNKSVKESRVNYFGPELKIGGTFRF